MSESAEVSRWSFARRWGPFLAFAGGFVFDSLTLGTSVSQFDLYLVTFYVGIAGLMLALRLFLTGSAFRRYTGWMLQFCLGGCLSAVVVLYFLSTGYIYSYLFVTALFLLAIYNELSEHADAVRLRARMMSALTARLPLAGRIRAREEVSEDLSDRRALMWAVWCLAAAMLTNFVVPHAVGTVRFWMFYLCVAGAFGVILVFRFVSRTPWREVRPAALASTVLVVAWVLGIVPPVPLVQRNSIVCTDFTKSRGEYTCMQQEQPVLARLGVRPLQVSASGEPVYYLTAVFAPRNIDATVEHRWYRHVDGSWEQTDDMSFDMTGGRDDGWRFWSRKRSIPPGKWRVETALEGGAVLGTATFEVVEASASKARVEL